MSSSASEESPAAPTVAARDRDGRAFEVRPLRADDRPALVAFYDRFEPKRAAQGLPPAGVERITRWLDGVLSQGVHLVGLRDERLIAHAFIVPTERDGTGEYAVFLDAAERGRGAGTELNRIAVAAARAAGFTRLWLSAEPHNRPAIRSYEKVGFRYRPGTGYSPELEMEMEL